MKKFVLPRKESIVLSAIEIINELGLQGLSTKELAKKQGITEGALYKHFNSKDEIITAVLDYYVHYDGLIRDSIEVKNLTPKQALIFTLKSYAEYYENYPAITSIENSYEFLRYDANASNKIKGIFKSRETFISSLIEKGINEGEFSDNTDKRRMAEIILGAFREITLKWRIDEYSFSLKDEVLEVLNIIFNRTK